MLVIFALLLPLILLPIAGYAVQASLLATRAALLQAAAAGAAEDGAQVIDVAAFRAIGVLRLDPARARRVVAASFADRDRQAQLDGVDLGSISVRVRAHDQVPMSFGGFLSAGSVRLAAVATARLAAGYGRPDG
jgi:hypothetical protein